MSEIMNTPQANGYSDGVARIIEQARACVGPPTSDVPSI
jgi:hypothetical protein